MLKGDSNERFKQRTGVGCNPSNQGPLLTASGRSLNALALRQKRVVIVGATGMVGGHALRLLIKNTAAVQFSRRTSTAGRSPLGRFRDRQRKSDDEGSTFPCGQLPRVPLQPKFSGNCAHDDKLRLAQGRVH